MTHRFKNYINITFIDAKYNFCDLCIQCIKKRCPLQPGIYYYNYWDIITPLLWTVSANFIIVYTWLLHRESMKVKLLFTMKMENKYSVAKKKWMLFKQ